MSDMALFEGTNSLVSSDLFKSLQEADDNLAGGGGGGDEDELRLEKRRLRHRERYEMYGSAVPQRAQPSLLVASI